MCDIHAGQLLTGLGRWFKAGDKGGVGLQRWAKVNAKGSVELASKECTGTVIDQPLNGMAEGLTKDSADRDFLA